LNASLQLVTPTGTLRCDPLYSHITRAAPGESTLGYYLAASALMGVFQLRDFSDCPDNSEEVQRGATSDIDRLNSNLRQ
jgi:hypothetical protein